MIKFYRTRKCKGCAAIEEALTDLRLAHDASVLQSSADLPSELQDAGPLPIMVDGDDIFQGSERIIAHMGELEGIKKLWYKFESDACYCDEEGNIL